MTTFDTLTEALPVTTDVTTDPASAREADLPLLSQLDVLESEAMLVIREITAELERPVLLFSGGKDSVVMLHVAAKAFWPAPIPFPVLHVDTGHNFPEVLAYRDATVERLGLRLEVASVQDWIDDGRLRERADGTRNPLQTQPLLEAIATGTASTASSAVAGVTRRRPAPRSASSACATTSASGTPRTSAPSCGTSSTRGTAPASTCGSSRCRTGPSSTCGATSSARASSCPASTTRTSARSSSATACSWPSARSRSPAPARRAATRRVRYRTVGDMSCTGAVESDAASVADVVTEVAASTLTERGATRADDRISEAAMEDRKKEGYF